MTRKVRLKFADRYRESILDGDKRATIRYEFDRPAAPEDYLHLLDSDGEHFASAALTRVTIMTAFDCAASDIDGHRAYADVDALLDALGEFYPDADLSPNTYLTVIGWTGAHRKGRKRWCEVCRTA